MTLPKSQAAYCCIRKDGDETSLVLANGLLLVPGMKRPQEGGYIFVFPR
jgi:hypothetical protein